MGGQQSSLFTLKFSFSHSISHCETQKKGSNEKEAVISPNMVRQYNSYMGGVDLMDQKKVTYQFDVFFYFLFAIFILHSRDSDVSLCFGR